MTSDAKHELKISKITKTLYSDSEFQRERGSLRELTRKSCQIKTIFIERKILKFS